MWGGPFWVYFSFLFVGLGVLGLESIQVIKFGGVPPQKVVLFSF